MDLSFDTRLMSPGPAPAQVRKSRRGPRDCGKQVHLGGFDTAHAPARAFDPAAIKFRGVDSDINFTVGDYEEDMKQVFLYECSFGFLFSPEAEATTYHCSTLFHVSIDSNYHRFMINRHSMFIFSCLLT
ncbi:hypothetical protein HID58_046587 [Brassica napus]|uniref:AP2/ERF domain-containing protein n=1 Tax=Brassica napus TaxID=3708 RepID=A0ABQ8AWY8_BRANA|nr:hypothetical protein HID58_046587 [Brassica napus]